MISDPSSKCPECGKDLVLQERFCPYCGAELNAGMDKNQALALKFFEKAQFNYNQNRKLQSALADCELALEHDPTFAEAHNLRGLILDALDLSDEAIIEYREAIRLNPYFEEAQANLKDAESEQITSGYGISPSIQDSEQGGELRRLLITGGVGLILLLLMVGGYYVVNRFLLPIFGPTTELVFVPDVPESTTVSKNDLEDAANILTERSKLLGYSQITFRASSNGAIVANIPATINGSELASQIGQVGLLEFVDFGNEQVMVGQEVRTDIENPYMVQVEGKTWHTVISNDAIVSADAVKPADSYQVFFTLNEEGKQVFAFHTAKHIGKYLGIVFDKVVISNPIIQQAITKGEGVISGNFNQETAQQLAAVLNTKPLPFEVKLVEK